jgi:N-acetyl-anhydromuramyl-L-alanine amidase AmpD
MKAASSYEKRLSLFPWQLSEQLVRKQEALDAALSNVYAAEARFKASEARVKTLESQLAAAEYDVESPAGKEEGPVGGGRGYWCADGGEG